MMSALFYLQTHSFKNRIVSRLKRLKRPKYLAGALVGGAYLYFFFFRHWLQGARHTWSRDALLTPELSGLIGDLGSLALFAIVLLGWVWPHKRAALEFTEAEIAFLFPAPISRRSLIHFKLLKSQLGILISAFFMTLFSGGLTDPHRAWIRLVGWWILLSTLNLHFLGASFARTLLLERGVARWKYRVAVAVVAFAALGSALYYAVSSITSPTPETFSSVENARAYVQQAIGSGPARYVLYPFRVALQPMLSLQAGRFLLALGPAALLLALHYFWVIRSNVAFEEASVEAARTRAVTVAAMRAGNLGGSKSRKRRKPPFALNATGARHIALLWKNLIAAGQMFRLPFLLVMLWIAIFASVGLSNLARESGLLPAIGFLALMFASMSLLMGPQVMRQDLRQDLRVADVLKMYPLPGWQVVLGELLAPAVILTALQWLLLIVGVLLGELPGQHGGLSLANRVAFGAGAGMLAPMLNLISLLVLNAAALLFPAWTHLGPGAAHGIEVMGQRIIMMFAQMLVFMLALVPAAIAFVAVFLVAKPFWGMAAGLLLGSVIATIGLAAESGLGMWLLGGVFERFDLSDEPLT